MVNGLNENLLGFFALSQSPAGQALIQQAQGAEQAGILGEAGFPVLGQLAQAGVPVSDITNLIQQRRIGEQQSATRDLIRDLLTGQQGQPVGQPQPVSQASQLRAQGQALLLSPQTAALGQATLRQAEALEQEERALARETRQEERQVAREQRSFDRKFEEQIKKGLTPENAAKVALVQRGKSSLQKARDLFFDDKGDFKESVALGASSDPTSPLGTPIATLTGAFSQEARQARSLMLNAINAQLRAESGAAVPEEEVRRGFARFVPTPLDDAETAKLKLEQLEELLDQTEQLTRPEIARDAPTEAPAPTVIRFDAQGNRIQ